MSAFFQDLTCGTMSVCGPLGEGLNIPVATFPPTGGVLSAYQAYIGPGSLPTYGQAALSVGPLPTAPFSLNKLGVELMTGIAQVLGFHVTTGTHTILGDASVDWAALGNRFTGAEFTVSPISSDVSPEIPLTAAKGDLAGVWFINGLPVSGEPDVTSDIRLKKNIERFEDGLNIVLNLKPVRFDWREDKCPTSFLKEYREPDDEYGYPGKIKRQYGLIAQEVEEIAPDLVGERKMYDENYKLIRYEKIVPILISAVQDQQKQIEDLKNEIKALREEINTK